MSTIVTRAGKGSALTWAEADANFTNLNTDKLEATDRPYSDTNPIMDGSATQGTSPKVSRQDHVHPKDTSKADLASPTFTGTPAAPTASVGTNTTQIATTAYVKTEIPSVAYTKTEIDNKHRVLVVANRSSGGISVPAGYGSTTVIYDTEVSDTTSIYNNSTGIITIADAGLYQFDFSCRYTNGTTGGDISISLLRSSGSGVGASLYSNYDLIANQLCFPMALAIYTCSAGDTFKVVVSAKEAGTVADGGSSNNVLIVTRIG